MAAGSHDIDVEAKSCVSDVDYEIARSTVQGL